jgi:hypothetical protein
MKKAANPVIYMTTVDGIVLVIHVGKLTTRSAEQEVLG